MDRESACLSLGFLRLRSRGALRRASAGTFLCTGVIFTVSEYVDVPVLTPGLFDQSVYLVLHLSALIRGNGMCFCSVQEVNKEIVKAVVEICPSAPPDYRA